MTTREMTVEEHSRTALTFLGQSEQEFAAGDILQGSEKLWGATAHIVMAVAKQHGWPTRSHRNLVDAVVSLAEERDEELLLVQFHVAEVFHRQFYGHGYFDPFAETDSMNLERAAVARFVRRVVEIVGEAT